MRYHDCPTVNTDAIEQDPQGEWIAGEFEQRPEIPPPFLDRWILFRSGQFTYNRAVVEHAQIGNEVHYLEVIWLVTQVYQFAARMARDGALSPEALIRLQLHNVAGRGLYTADFFGEFWSREKRVDAARTVHTGELLGQEGRDLAMQAALEIYAKFGWADAPEEKILEQQSTL
ncbi:MAG TPA: hypothetical protein VN737_14200 [Bryobacteraceae bacterium]|nr:hypothetical protein [Bryobacteraceae bacterium]